LQYPRPPQTPLPRSHHIVDGHGGYVFVPLSPHIAGADASLPFDAES
jgi:hypothetical protein